jgi:hypothetical protein
MTGLTVPLVALAKSCLTCPRERVISDYLEVPLAKRRAPSLEEIAAEVGRLFGTTEAHARKWLQQRNTMLEALHLVRGKASELIDELSGENRRQLKRRARAQAQRVQVPTGHASEMTMGRKKRRLSAATRAKMRAAAKKRWAEKRSRG